MVQVDLQHRSKLRLSQQSDYNCSSMQCQRLAAVKRKIADHGISFQGNLESMGLTHQGFALSACNGGEVQTKQSRDQCRPIKSGNIWRQVLLSISYSSGSYDARDCESELHDAISEASGRGSRLEVEGKQARDVHSTRQALSSKTGDFTS